MRRRFPTLLLPAIAAAALLVQAAWAQASEEKRLAEEIQKAQADQDFLKVAEAYTRVVQIRPNDAAAWQGLGVAQVLLLRYDEAIPALEKAVKLDGRLWGAALYLGMSYYRTNRFADAKTSLAAARALNPSDAAIRYWLGAAHTATGDYRQAIAELKVAVKSAPEDGEALYLLARSFAEYAAQLESRVLAAGDSPWAASLRAADAVDVDSRMAALTELEKVTARHPGLPGMHLDLGLVLWEQKRYVEAAAAFGHELAIDPWNVRARSRLAAFLLETGQPAEAAQHIQLALRLSPSDVETIDLSRLVTTPSVPAAGGKGGSCASEGECLAQGNIGKALALLERGAAKRPSDLPAFRRLILAYLAGGRLEEAYTRTAELLRQSPGSPEAEFLLARICQRSSQDAGERLLSKYPDSARAHMMRGEAFERQRGQNYQRALAEYLAALQAEPDIVGANYAAGRVLWKMQRYDEAARRLNQELLRNPHHSGAHYYLGRTLQMSGDPHRAVRHLEAAVTGNAAHPDSWRALGRAQMEVGQPDAAVSSYRRALSRTPDDPGLYALLGNAYKAFGNSEEARKAFEMSRRLSASRSSKSQEPALQ